MTKKKKTVKARTKTGNKDGDVCIKCPSICCSDLTYTITRPRTREDIDELKWDLQYDTVRVFIKNRRWHEIIEGKCIYLLKNNLCKIYDRRPKKCRDHMPPDCDRFGEYYDVLIQTPEELEAYLTGPK